MLYQRLALWCNKVSQHLCGLQISAIPLVIQLSAKVPEKAKNDEPSTRATISYMRDQDGDPRHDNCGQIGSKPIDV